MNIGRFKIEDAVRRGRKAKLAVTGVTGSGKTFWMLKVAKALANGDISKVLVIDTELQGPTVGSAAQYVEHFGKFKHVVFTPPYSPVDLTELVLGVADQFEVIVVDSLSHFWLYEGGALDRVDQAAKRMKTENRFAGWKDVTPEQNKMVGALLASPAHTLVTMRQKMEYILEENEKGRKVPKKLGLAPIQRDDLAYEFNVFAELNADHELFVSKTRCFELGDKLYRKDQADEFAKTYKNWLDGAEDAPPPQPAPKHTPPAGHVINEAQRKLLFATAKDNGLSHEALKARITETLGVESTKEIPASRFDELLRALNGNGSAPEMEGAAV